MKMMLLLANALDCLPLAIKQATGYITATHTSIKDYLTLFSKDDGHQRRLLEKTYGDIGRDTHDDLQDSVILTWQISFDRIRHQRPAAANILSLMGNFYPEDILIDLLKGESTDEIEFQEDIGTLIQYSLISKKGDGVSFSMHRLVRLTIRTWLMNQGTLEKWDAKASRSVMIAFLHATRSTDPERLDHEKALRLFFHKYDVNGSEMIQIEKLKEVIGVEKLKDAYLSCETNQNEKLKEKIRTEKLEDAYLSELIQEMEELLLKRAERASSVAKIRVLMPRIVRSRERWLVRKKMATQN